MNSNRKGQRTELLAAKTLAALGYTVHRAVRTGRLRGTHFISNANDVFGCIDIIAKRMGPGERTLWVQVTAGYDVGRRIDKIKGIPWSIEVDDVQVWRHVPARRKPKGAPGWSPGYFHAYKLDQGFALVRGNRVPAHIDAKTASFSINATNAH